MLPSLGDVVDDAIWVALLSAHPRYMYSPQNKALMNVTSLPVMPVEIVS